MTIIEKLTKLFLRGWLKILNDQMNTDISLKSNKYSNAKKMTKWPSDLTCLKFSTIWEWKNDLKPNDYPCSFSSTVFSKCLKYVIRNFLKYVFSIIRNFFKYVITIKRNFLKYVFSIFGNFFKYVITIITNFLMYVFCIIGNFWSKKFFRSKKYYGAKKILGSKNFFWSKNFLGRKKFLGRKNFVCQTLDTPYILAQIARMHQT